MNIDIAPPGPLDDPLGDVDERQMLLDKVDELEADRNDLAIRWAQSSQAIAHLARINSDLAEALAWMVKKIDDYPIGLDESNWLRTAREALTKAGVL